jgi:hypothetical protein
MNLTASTSYGWPTSPTSGCARSSSTWPWCWMPSRAKWSDGRWTATSPLRLALAGLCNAPSPCANPLPAWCTTPIAASSTPPAVHAPAPHPRHPAQHEPPGNPYDNAFCESFIKTLKREQIYASKYEYIDELSAQLEDFIDVYYNRLRLHSALGYKTPEQFEAARLPEAAVLAPTVSFPRHGEIYRSWKRRRGRPSKASGEPVQPGSPAHRIDESPVGYSLTGWSPPEPVSASPTETYNDEESTK